MTGAITWEFVTAIAGVLTVVAGIWRYLETRINRAELAAQDIRKDLETRVALLNSSLTTVQLMAAEKYASREVLKETKDEIIQHMERVQASVDRLSVRLDSAMRSRTAFGDDQI